MRGLRRDAPGERHAPAAGVYSAAMMIPPPYRPAVSPAVGFGAAIFQQGDLCLSSGSTLKKRNFVGIMLNSSPILASPFALGG